MSPTNVLDRGHDGGPRPRVGGGRRGSSLLEVQVAFAVLGVGLIGMCQFVVMQLRQVRILEQRLQGQVVQSHRSTGTNVTMLTAQTYYLVPWQNPWTQKLSGAAQVVNGSSAIPCDPGPLQIPMGQSPTSYWVDVIELDASPTSQSITASVNVSAPASGS